MTLDNFLSGLSADERADLEERLRILAEASGTGYQVVSNLRNESRLSEAAWCDIVEALLQSTRRAGSLKRAYVEACRKHILEGETLPSLPTSGPPIRYGRAVLAQRFYKMLVERGYFRSTRDAQAFVQRLLSLPLKKVQRRLQGKYLGQFLMWATFDPHDPDKDPFS